MKTKRLLIVLLFVSLSLNIVHAQLNRDSCAILNGTIAPYLDKYRCEMDTEYYDYTSIEKDDTAAYSSYYTLHKAGGDERLIFFTHGYGGKPRAWLPASVDLSATYKYVPKKPEYLTENGDQDNFTFASRKVRDDLLMMEDAFTRLEHNTHIDVPYYIGHSLGGLIGRDIDKKLDVPPPGAGTDAYIYDPTGLTRKFHGLVTFGTPHAGAMSAINQDKMDKLGIDLCNSMKDVYITGKALDLVLKKPLLNFVITTNTLNLASELGTRFCGALGDVLEVITAQKRAPIGFQFAPASTLLSNPEAQYLIDLNDYTNPNLPKVAFYGVEKEPVFWRIAQYMIHPSEEFTAFAANEDDKIVEDINQMIFDFSAQHIKLEQDRERINADIKNRKKVAVFNAFISPVLVATAVLYIKQMENQSSLILAKSNAVANASTLLSRANEEYEYIIGAIDRANPASWVNISTFKCKVKYKVNTLPIPIKFEKTFDIANSNDCSCNNGNFNRIIGNCVGTELVTITTTVLRPMANDGAVVAASAMAFPGCPDIYKHKMLNSNHLQMRNDNEAYRCLRILFDANPFTNLAPVFFNVPLR